MAKKLCKWKQKRIASRQEKLHEIVRAPRFVCLRCGRAAGEKKWLCSPQELTR